MVTSSGEGVLPPPAGMPPRLPLSRTTRRSASGRSRLCASPRGATPWPGVGDPSDSRGLPAGAVGAARAATRRATAHAAPPRPAGAGLWRVARPHPAPSSTVFSRVPLASDSGLRPRSCGQTVPLETRGSPPGPSQRATASRLAGRLFSAAVGMAAARDGRAPGPSARPAPSPVSLRRPTPTGSPPAGGGGGRLAGASRRPPAATDAQRCHPAPYGRGAAGRGAPLPGRAHPPSREEAQRPVRQRFARRNLGDGPRKNLQRSHVPC